MNKTLTNILTENDVYLDATKWQYYTDKELHHVGGHKYCSTFYDDEFLKYRDIENVSILEIGVLRGASICLWNEYFNNPIITGLDIVDRTPENPEFSILKHSFYDTTLILIDAYTKESSDKLGQFDIILDDGSHTFYHQCEFLKYYPTHLNKNGVLIIEDIQSYDYLDTFVSLIDQNIYSYRIIDTREECDQYDNLLFVVTRK